jgi:diketogulonate reductase-like aldo/keto reductase
MEPLPLYGRDMQHVRFGRTGLKVSRLCLGTMTFGYQCDEETSFAIMDAAAEAGITFFDTADVYPLGAPPEVFGRTEEILGAWLKGKRHNFILATKCDFPTGPKPWDAGNSRKNIMRALDASLRRLGTDYVDLYQLHSWDADTPIDETLQALDDVVRSGKVRYIGCSNFLAYQLARSIGRAEVLRTANFISVQPRYNLLFREQRELCRCVPKKHRGDSVQPSRRRISQWQAPAGSPDRGRAVHVGLDRRPIPGAVLERPHVQDHRRAAAHRRSRRCLDGDDINGCWPTRPSPVHRRRQPSGS